MTYAAAKQHYATVANTARSSIQLFTSIELAQSAAQRGDKRQMVVLGEDGWVIVSTPRVTEALVKAGYQYA